MTALLPNYFHPAYELDEALREDVVSLAVHSEQPSEADREEIVLKKLGARGWGRLHHFRYFYGQGWGGGTGRSLSPRALEGFYRFLEQAHLPQGCSPSLFLTDSGHLELSWEDSAGRAIQIEFTPTGAEFYVEANEREGFVSYADLSKLPPEFSPP